MHCNSGGAFNMTLVEIFTKILKWSGGMSLIVIFLYWSIEAIFKFSSMPITSTVSYRFGDDGNGKIEFPTISICLASFELIGKSKK